MVIANLKVYVINLDRRIDRWLHMVNLFSKIDPSITICRISATDTIYDDFEALQGRLDKLSSLRSFNIVSTKRDFRLYDHENTKGSVGCFLSHYNLWIDIIQNKNLYVDEPLFIFEDDSDIEDLHFTKRLMCDKDDNLRRLLKSSADIVLIGHSGFRNYRRMKAQGIFSPKLIKVKSFQGTHAYAITKRGLLKIIREFVTLEMQIDWELSKLAQENQISIYALAMPCVSTKASLGSDIQTPIKLERNENDLQN